jgi:malonate-semialdehyde dehydrogenase (acetylating)/methylmalonate-semialdehyde dehydrogenase
MALTTAVVVGEANNWLPEVAKRAAKLKISAGHEPDADLGPVTTPEAVTRISGIIQSAADEGATILVITLPI